MADAAINDAFISIDMDDNKDIFNSYPAEGDRHISFLSAFEDEVMETEHAFLDVGQVGDKDGGHLGFGTYDLEKCFGVGNISSSIEYDEMIKGSVDSTLNVGEETEREFFDGMLQGTKERTLHELRLAPQTSNMQSLDAKPMGGHSGDTYGPAGGSVLKLGLENELQTASGVRNAQSSPHIQDAESLTGEKPLGKRLHKPPRRYIEEYVEHKSRSISQKACRTCCRASKVKPLSVKTPKDPTKQLPNESNGTLLSMHEEEPFAGACIQVPFGLPVEEEQVKETPASLGLSIVLWHDSDNCMSNLSTISNERSDVECLSAPVKLLEDVPKADREVRTNVQKGKRRRKHHIPWTQSEVMKLIEGISNLGVGSWSKIKKLLFPSSKHRTSVDLKDKWRNLVKASNTQLRKKRKGIRARKQLTQQAPEPVLRRVRELARLQHLPEKRTVVRAILSDKSLLLGGKF
ncbi:hypothetical protein SAY87_019529 [Trapa incisa]|uniref:Uncharacterized protein n=1 Tax=Trapa incisa TaxID=236973 RepID=A0AAN7K5W7_9MYRT|nr:hypothetical protein SAY87_019529 [Trapa incisa]